MLFKILFLYFMLHLDDAVSKQPHFLFFLFVTKVCVPFLCKLTHIDYAHFGLGFAIWGCAALLNLPPKLYFVKVYICHEVFLDLYNTAVFFGFIQDVNILAVVLKTLLFPQNRPTIAHLVRVIPPMNFRFSPTTKLEYKTNTFVRFTE